MTLGLPATIFMDRKHPEKLPAIQLSFIQHLVSPLFQACAEAGIIPGILEPVVPPTRGSTSPGHTPPGNTLKLPGSGMEAVMGERASKSEGENGVDNIRNDSSQNTRVVEEMSTLLMSLCRSSQDGSG